MSSPADKPLLARLLELPEVEREAFLRQACAVRPDLERGLMAELSMPRTPDFAARGFEARWEDPWSGLKPGETAVSAFEAALRLAVTEKSGAKIGPYKLLNKIGEGGFGVVWMAEQSEPIQRRVALKIVKIGMDTEEVIARFEVERQALALMEHANIARVFDAGATDSGRPYFVMELVRGVAITRYCDENRLSPEARLQLFITVCHAVQHAHQKGVIHRDLKPSNILVTLHDGVPVPKIIDFGIAKATSGRLTDKTLFTQFSAFIGTPAYTSPEQMEMSGLDVDTRSDIYSLGVLLYQLLTGRPPFDAKALVKSGLEAMRRTILEVEPPRPSHCLGTFNEPDRISVAQQRGTDPEALSLLLRGDLDWIVMRCLEKDRTRRYPSAANLAADVDRHLHDEPVEARPPSRIYRAKKFVRRHRLVVFSGVVAAASLVAGLIVSSTLYVSARAARDRATVAEKREGVLRRQAEIGRADEVKRAARTALDVANRHLADGRVGDGLAYLVYAARKDPHNPALGPRLVSVLATHNFLLPDGAPFDCCSRVLAVRYTKDGRSIHVGTEDGVLRVFDAMSGALQRENRLSQRVSPGGWQFARDNDEICVVCFVDLHFGVFDLKTGERRGPLRALEPGVRRGPGAGISPDGRWVYALRSDEFSVWDARTDGLLLQRKAGAGEFFNASDFTADGAHMVVTDGRGARRWTLPDGRPIDGQLGARDAPLWTTFAASQQVKFSPSGRIVALSGTSTNIDLFDTATGLPLRPLVVPANLRGGSSFQFASDTHVLLSGGRATGLWDIASGAFKSLPFAANSFDAVGNRVLAMGRDGFVRISDLHSGELIAEPLWRQRLACAALAPDGIHVITGTTDGIVQRFRVGQGAARPLVLPRIPVSSPMAFLPGSPSRFLRMKATEARVVDTASGRETGAGFVYPTPIEKHGWMTNTDQAVRADGKFAVVLTVRGWQAWELGPNGVTHVAPLEGLEDTSSATIRVRFSPRGDLIAFGLPEKDRFGVWNLRTGALAWPPYVHPTAIRATMTLFSPDGQRIACGTADGICVMLDVATGRPSVGFVASPQVPIHALAWSPDGTRIITANDRNEIRVWNAATGEPLSAAIVNTEPRSEGSVRYSPDGRWFAMWGVQTNRIRDGYNGLPVGDIIPAGFNPSCFSPDGRSLGSADDEGVARVWDVPSGQPLTEPMRHGGASMRHAEFSPEGRFLRTQIGNEYHVWSVPPRLPEGAAVPEWLLQLASALAARRIDEAGQAVDLPDAVGRVDAVRRQIMALPADSPLTDWGRWILDASEDRPIAPGFTITPAEANKLAATRS